MFGATPAEKADGYRAFSELFAAGVPLRQIFDHFMKISDRRDRKVIRQVLSSITRGDALSDALDRTGAFFGLDVELIRAGERTGDVVAMTRTLSERYREEHAALAEVRAGMMQPVILILSGAFIFPAPDYFLERISGLGYLLQAGSFAGLFFVPAWAGYRAYTRSRNDPSWAAARDRILLGVPWLRNLVRESNLERFCTAWGLLIAAGVPLPESIEGASRTVGSPRMAAAARQLIAKLAAGVSLADAMADPEVGRGIFDAALRMRLATAALAGALPETLRRSAADYRLNNSYRLKAISVWLPRLGYAIVTLVIAHRILRGFPMPDFTMPDV